MPKRTDHDHYERAFEAWLRSVRAPFVSVEQVRRAAGPEGPIKNFDFLVHAGARHYIVDVKGKRFPRGTAGREIWWENWVHFSDLEGLFAWENHFGEGYEALLAFCYWLQMPLGTGSIFPSPEKWCLSPSSLSSSPAKKGTVPSTAQGDSPLFRLAGRDYLFVAVPARAFAANCRRRSARWQAVHVPEKQFTRLIRPIEHYIPGAPPRARTPG
jgi:hypothetical protein